MVGSDDGMLLDEPAVDGLTLGAPDGFSLNGVVGAG